jgi:hypothetical protein
MLASFFLGRHAYIKALDSCNVEVVYLRETKKILTEEILDCWHDLPMGLIREGDIAR